MVGSRMTAAGTSKPGIARGGASTVMALLGDAGRLHQDHHGAATGGRANGYANVVSAAGHISNEKALTRNNAAGLDLSTP